MKNGMKRCNDIVDLVKSDQSMNKMVKIECKYLIYEKTYVNKEEIHIITPVIILSGIYEK